MHLKNIVKLFYDLIFLALSIPSSFVFLKYRKRGPINHPITTKFLKRIGLFPIRDHYYDPQFVYSDNGANLTKDRTLKGIDLNINSQLKFLKILTFSKELLQMKLKKKSSNYKFTIKNGSFENGDADFYYQIIRYLKPRKIIEIGSGHSTQICLEAINKNNLETGHKTNLLCIEPYENKWLEKINTKIIRKKIENVHLDWNKELDKGDILFIDTSHIIRPEGDVLKIFFEILPALKNGVIVHIHDIFTPKNYPKEWLCNHVRLWNEQYLVEALLMNNKRYKIISALNFLKNNFYKDLKIVCPYLEKDHQPSSLYLKICH